MIKRTPIKKISDKRRERLANGWWEKQVFLQLIEQRKRTDTSWRPITVDNAKSYQFAHILPKGMYPTLRLDPNNIIIVDSIPQHEWVDKMVAWEHYSFIKRVKEWKAVKILHNLYVSHFSWLE